MLAVGDSGRVWLEGVQEREGRCSTVRRGRHCTSLCCAGHEEVLDFILSEMGSKW